MSTEELQARYNKLLDLARKVRVSQRAYFKARATQDLEAAKKYERQLDSFIIEEIRAQETRQNTLF